ncbi:hypothetical protein ACFPN7_25930 [Amycolatopsis halotolerans]
MARPGGIMRRGELHARAGIWCHLELRIAVLVMDCAAAVAARRGCGHCVR